MHKHFKRIVSLMLAVITTLSIAVPAFAAGGSIESSKSTSVTVKMGERNTFLKDQTGKAIGGSYWQYTTNKDSVTGPAYCINHGLKAVPASTSLPIKSRYDASPKTLGAFASGYPQVTLADFIKDNNLTGLTEAEYEYATQLAVWASLGQLGVEGTQFTSGSQQVKNPSGSGDAQQIRVFKALQAILAKASSWTQNQWRGMYIRYKEDELGGTLELFHPQGLAGLSMEDPRVQLETIGGVDYYTVVYYASSATPTKPNGNTIDVTPYAPAGTILVDMDNNPLESFDKGAGTPTYRVPTTGPVKTNLNANGVEYIGSYKLCIPAENAAASGKIELVSSANVTQYELYIAYNENKVQQSYIIADPSVGLVYGSGAFIWSSEETAEGALQVTKTDGTGFPLSSATFELRGASGYTETQTTGEDGIVLWENLDPSDTYTLVETVAPPGYAPRPSMQVVVGANITTYITVRNDNACKVFIQKYDKQNNRVLEGAVFELKQIDGSFRTTGRTEFDGTLELGTEDLPFGSYEVRELSAPEGYLKDTSVQTFHWSGEADVYLSFLNVRVPGITLNKVSESGEPLSDAVFNVYKDGQVIRSVTTDYNGAAQFFVTEIGEGYYEFEEISAPDGYVLDSTKHGIHFDPYNPATQADPVVIVVNKAKPHLQIVKIDANTSVGVGGCTFEVYRDTKLVGSYITDSEGEIMITVDPGVYLVKEVGVPEGYVLNPMPQEIEILAGDGMKTLVFLNDPKPGLYILKVDELTGDFLANAEFSVEKNGGQIVYQGLTDSTGIIYLENLEPGWYTVRELAAPHGYIIRDEHKDVLLEPGKTVQVKFDNRPRPKLEILKVDTVTRQPLAGAKFKVTKTEDKTVSEYITGSDGRILIENLDEAIYTVEEITAPDGYILNPQHKEIALEWGKTKTLVYEDTRKPTLVITKTNALTYEPIPDTTYRIEYEHSNGGVALIDTYRTDANGQIILRNAEVGWYVITETLAAPGFTPSSNPVQRKYLAPGENSYTAFSTTSSEAGDVSGNNIRVTSGDDYIIGYEIINYPLNSIVIHKVNAVTGELLTGAVFELRQVSEDISGSSGTLIGRYTTDNSGTIVITGLIPGGYIVEEVKAPANYMLSENSMQQVWLKSDGTSIVETTFANIPYGGILITKVDAQTNKPLGNARFRVTDSTGAVVGNTNGEYITDENGEIFIPNVKPGAYVVTEIEAPANYVVDTTPQTIDVGVDGKIYKVSFKNQPCGSLLITKVDALTNAPLANARFKVTDSDGAVAGSTNGEFVTDSNGEILVTNLAPGAYVVTEIEAPEYYTIDTTPQTITVNADGKVYKLSFKNQPSGTLVLRKLDTVTKEPLADAVFKVTDSTGAVVGNSNGIFRTDATGTITIPYLPKGSYIIQEIEAPDGYILENQSQTIAIDYGKSYTLDFYNKKMSGAQIIKIDSITKQPLKGAKFTVYRMDGGIIGVYETDADGVIILDTLEPGWYKAAETKAPDGYLIDDKPQDFQITANQFVKLIFENAPMSGLLIRKVDADTRDPLEGAEFTVRAADGTLIGIYRSDTDGTAYIPALSPGWYTVTETAAPTGYTLGDNAQSVQITNSKVVTIEFKNRAFGSIVIKKLDEITGDPLTGATFTVSKQGGAFVGEYTTGKDGTISIPSVEPGWYVISETKAPTGYTMDSTAKTVEVKPVVPSVVTFTNKPLSGIEIIKTDAVTHNPLASATFTVERANGEKIGTYKTDAAGKALVTGLTEGTYIVSETIAPDGYMLNETPKTVVVTSGKLTTVEFANKPNSGIQIIKYDTQTKAPLTGATFLIERDNGERIGSYKTDSTGKIIVSDLTEGTYIVSETAAPSGYILDEAPKTVIVKSGKLTVVEFFNKPLSGLKIVKLNSATRQPIAGVEFAITKMSGEKVTNDFNSTTFKTDKTGQIYIPGLADGYYTVTETRAADGYILDGEPKTVLIQSGKPTVLEVLNTPMSGLLIVKTDAATGKPLAGVVFDVRRADGQFVAGTILDGNQPNTEANSPNKTTSPNGDITGSYTTDANGRILINGLPAGEYHVTERKALDGYELDTAVHAATVTPGKLTTLQITNKQKAGLRLVKIDSITKKPIYNVEFMIFDSNNKVVGTFYTDNQGVIDFSGILTEGRYTIRETRAAAGYYLDEIPKTVEFVSGKVTEIRWENVPKMAQIQIMKKSGDDNEVNGLPAGTPLAGATFEVYDYKTGNLVDRFVSGSDGRAVSAPLPLGRYIVKEVKAPQWYKLSDKTLDIELEFATQIVKVEYLNYSANTGVTIRKTGVAECMPGDTISYTIKEVRNTGTTPLTDFYWRDTLPTDAVRLTKIVTGTYNQALKYKVMITTNKGDTRIIADNLSTTKNNVIDCSNAALGLKSDEYVTSFTLLFGTVKASFAQVEQPQIFVKVLSTLPNGYEFANKVDVGGKYGSEWVVGNAVWVSKVYSKPVKLPRTGY